ncbi:hypothetical protein [Streptomyces griseoflavus]|uniref:hypothetical protein n=1 Tax=Streptomyces griseoflavus TaxID=35619 RepID=UPI0001B4E24C|nr:hypothetical protein [Streptomyces griseoflavus]
MLDPELLERITARRAELDETEAAPEVSAPSTLVTEPGLPEPTGIRADVRHPPSGLLLLGDTLRTDSLRMGALDLLALGLGRDQFLLGDGAV